MSKCSANELDIEKYYAEQIVYLGETKITSETVSHNGLDGKNMFFFLFPLLLFILNQMDLLTRKFCFASVWW